MWDSMRFFRLFVLLGMCAIPAAGGVATGLAPGSEVYAAGGPARMSFSNFADIRKTDGVLFSDDFTSYPSGSGGSPGWKAPGGRVEVIDEKGNKSCRVVSAAGARPVVRTASSWGADYVLEFLAKAVRPSSIGVIVRGKDERNYSCLTEQNGIVRYEEFRNGKPAASTDLGNYDTSDGLWHQWRIKVKGLSCEVDIDNGRFTGTYQSSAFSGGSRYIGFGVYPGEVVYDNVVIWTIDGYENKDSDGDGWTDSHERTDSLTDPYRSDTDGDGIADPADPYPLSVSTSNPQPTAEIRTGRGGVPTLFVNGRALGPMSFHWGDTPAQNTAQLAKAGFKVYFVLHYPEEDWARPYKARLDALDNSIKLLLSGNPDAYIVLRTSYATTPQSWAQRHQDQLFREPDGNVLPDYSFASESWKENVSRSLVALVNHVRASSYSNRVIGIVLGAGSTDEWGHWRSDFDYSPAMDKYLRRWLYRRYKGNLSAFRKAWVDPKVSFDTARVPAHKEGWKYTFGPFMNPAVTRQGIDYYTAHNAVVADKITYFARIVKKASRNQWLCGFFYADLTTVHYLLSGVTAMREVIYCPDIDFIATPYQYENRGLGDGCSQRGVIDSLKLHNKLWFTENDTRLHLNSESSQKQYGRPTTEKETVELLKRDFCSAFVRGTYGWWIFGWDNGAQKKFYNSSTLLNTLAEFQEIARSGLKYDRSSPREIAVIVDQDSLFLTHNAYSFWGIHREKIHELARIGAPYDFYLLDDLANPSMPDYKLYVFLNAFSLSDKKRSWIRQKVRKGNATAVWIYAPGLINEDAAGRVLDLDNMSLLTGIKFGCRDIQRKTDIEIIDSGHSIATRLHRGYRFGQFPRLITTGFKIIPPDCRPVGAEPVTSYGKLFYVNDPLAIPLGRYTNSNKVAFAIRQFPDWNSVYVGSVAVGSGVLREIARFAGVHIYNEDDDITYVNNSYIAIHTARGGPRTIRLPFKADVYDAFKGDAVIATGVTRFQIHLPARSTNLYRLDRIK